MTDLISRSAVLTVGNVRKVVEYDEAGYDMTYDAVPVEVIEALPALDAVPVVHARWIDESKEFEGFVIHSCCCSACGKNPLYRRDVDCTKTGTEVNFRYDQSNFCPNCGARMDEKEND